jgi:hypothetical protein
MNPALERRSENIGMELALGKLQGQIEGIVTSQARVERSLEDLARTVHARIDALHDREEVESDGPKITWKLLAMLLLAASGGGAGIKHLLEMIGQ